MDTKELKKYNLNLDQASFLIVRAMKAGMPLDYLTDVLEAISGAYLLGYGDATIGKERKEYEYSPEDILIKIEQAKKGGDS